MRRLLMASAIAALPFLAFGPVGLGPTTALAASSSERACDLLGGEYVKDGPDATCITPPEPVGNAPEHSNAQRTTLTVKGQGNLGNKTEIDCSGPPGQQDPACP